MITKYLCCAAMGNQVHSGIVSHIYVDIKKSLRICEMALGWNKVKISWTPVTRIRFQIVSFSFRCVFKSVHFGLRIQMLEFS